LGLTSSKSADPDAAIPGEPEEWPLELPMAKVVDGEHGLDAENMGSAAVVLDGQGAGRPANRVWRWWTEDVAGDSGAA
jgi:hypothetical protein